MATIEIKLTDEQIELIVQDEKRLIQEVMEEKIKSEEDAYNMKIKEIRNEANEAISKLYDKYKSYNLTVEPSIKTTKEFEKLTKDSITRLYNEGKTVKEMAEHFGKSEPSIRQKLRLSELKMLDRKISLEQL